jgi:hypothetical protein
MQGADVREHFVSGDGATERGLHVTFQANSLTEILLQGSFDCRRVQLRIWLSQLCCLRRRSIVKQCGLAKSPISLNRIFVGCQVIPNIALKRDF